MADSSTLSMRGQVTIPRELRERMGLQTGDQIAFTLLSDGTLVARPRSRRVTDLAGLLHKPGGAPVSLDDMKVDLSGRYGGSHS